MSEIPDNKSIILFDGVCNFCDNSINRVIRNDKKDHFRFAPLQSETGKTLTKKYAIDTSVTDSVILIENETVYTRSAAMLKICKQMDGLYPILYGFMIVPPFIRDGIYNWIARNRYRWFGRKESCMIPTAAVRSKFLD